MKLQGKRIAILATDGFEQSELFEPMTALEKEGAQISIISPKVGMIKAWNHQNWGDEIEVSLALEKASADDFDALVLPGGVMNPDRLRMDSKAIQFASSFFSQGKPIAAICHGPWLLIETGYLNGRTMTSWPSLKTDLIHSGVQWVDEEVVSDRGLVTSRNPDDIPAFNRKMIEEFAEGRHSPGLKRSGYFDYRQKKNADDDFMPIQT